MSVKLVERKDDFCLIFEHGCSTTIIPLNKSTINEEHLPTILGACRDFIDDDDNILPIHSCSDDEERLHNYVNMVKDIIKELSPAQHQFINEASIIVAVQKYVENNS
jgi:hypothetical protein